METSTQDLSIHSEISTELSSSTKAEEKFEWKINVVLVLHSFLGVCGIVSNAIVVIVLASNKKLRRKIPIKFIINQVRHVRKVSSTKN